MSGNGYVVLAYVIGLGLIVGYAVALKLGGSASGGSSCELPPREEGAAR